MDAMGVVYLQYWLQEMCEETFKIHLNVLKQWYCKARWISEGDKKRLIPTILDCFKLEMEQLLVKLSMISNTHGENFLLRIFLVNFLVTYHQKNFNLTAT